MRRSLPLLVLPVLVAATVMVDVGASAAPSGPPPGTAVSVTTDPAGAKAPALARGLIVKARTDTPARRASIARSARTELPDGNDVASTSSAPAGLSVLRLQDPVPVGELDAAIAEIDARADVEWVIADRLRSTSSVPPVSVDDPHFLIQGNLWDTRDTIDGLPTNGGFSTKAPALWRSTKGDPSVVVAVVDTGLAAHPDLVGQTVAGYDFVDDECTPVGDACHYDRTYINAGDGNGWDADPADPGDWLDEGLVTKCFGPIDDPADYTADSSWHGTHVAGTVAAKAGNGIGVAGVAPGVKVQPVRVMGHCGGWDLDIVFGILWASGEDLREYGVPLNPTPAKVVNLSLGGVYDSAAEAAQDCELYSDVATVARARGVTLVAAAGNASGQAIAPLNLSVPASCAGYVSVTASSDTGHRSWYSTAGEGADIAAPGGDMQVPTTSAERGILSTINLGATRPAAAGYGFYQGTSMAAPAVAAGAALLYSLGITGPAAVEPGLKSAVQPFSTVPYGQRTIGGGTASLTTDELDCTTTGRTACGAGILDLSRVTAPLGAPKITGTPALGVVLQGQSRGLTNGGAGSTITWWRGATKVGTGATYRVVAADLGRTLTVRDTVASGPFAGASRAASVDVPVAPTPTPKPTPQPVAKVKATVRMSVPSKVKRTKRVPVTVRIAARGVRPTGTVRVYDGRKRLATRKLQAKHGGSLRITLPKLKKGKHRIRVVYSGSATVRSAATSKVVRSR
ncbi:S8 family serine peptidase [Aeromicrobium senzhongii]|uniref:S8 family serine peptidase n=1 Tax=Aeromicrobium senzhongii TaxID=2663859 RepID=A0ABX6SWN4_9ACTN|nr:S8 family serine peptidase [Aeromicrobium senzhongii]MTB88154.1 S8 family serine peptidase [Aeromicrobium senzhongii]QNL94854.1 S8 family serine peptidase [Aeromicrobium senzhongii]